MKTVLFHFVDGVKEVKVGDIFISVNSSRRSGITNQKIEKIGNKLITCSRSKFYIENGKQQSEYSADNAYSSVEAYNRIVEENTFIRKVHNQISGYGCKISFEQAKQINEIMGFKI